MNIDILDETGELERGYKREIKKISVSVLNYMDSPKTSELSISFIKDEKMRELNRSYRDIDSIFNEYDVKDFKLVGYTSDEEIKVDMLAPKE